MSFADYIQNNRSLGGATASNIIGDVTNVAKDQQDYLIKQQMQQAKKYREDLPNTIEGNYAAQRNNISSQYNDARKNLLANMNARGVLKSGQSKLQQGNLESSKAADLINARSNVIDNAQRTASALETDPMFGLANINEANLRQQSTLDEINNARDNYINQLVMGGYANAGRGLGTGLGNLSTGYSFGGNK